MVDNEEEKSKEEILKDAIKTKVEEEISVMEYSNNTFEDLTHIYALVRSYTPKTSSLFSTAEWKDYIGLDEDAINIVFGFYYNKDNKYTMFNTNANDDNKKDILTKILNKDITSAEPALQINIFTGNQLKGDSITYRIEKLQDIIKTNKKNETEQYYTDSESKLPYCVKLQSLIELKNIYSNPSTTIPIVFFYKRLLEEDKDNKNPGTITIGKNRYIPVEVKEKPTEFIPICYEVIKATYPFFSKSDYNNVITNIKDKNKPNDQSLNFNYIKSIQTPTKGGNQSTRLYRPPQQRKTGYYNF